MYYLAFFNIFVMPEWISQNNIAITVKPETWVVMRSPFKVKHINDEFESEVYFIQHYVIKFVIDLRQVGGFLCVLRFPPPIKLTTSVVIGTDCIYIVVNPTTIRSQPRLTPHREIRLSHQLPVYFTVRRRTNISSFHFLYLFYKCMYFPKKFQMAIKC
jgi:hypothetical protein